MIMKNLRLIKKPNSQKIRRMERRVIPRKVKLRRRV